MHEGVQTRGIFGGRKGAGREHMAPNAALGIEHVPAKGTRDVLHQIGPRHVEPLRKLVQINPQGAARLKIARRSRLTRRYVAKQK